MNASSMLTCCTCGVSARGCHDGVGHLAVAVEAAVRPDGVGHRRFAVEEGMALRTPYGRAS